MMMIVADEAGGLQTMDESILLGQTPVERGVLVLIPPSVKPYSSYLAVIGKEFGELIVHECIVRVPVLLVNGSACTQTCTAKRSVFTLPVDVRVVEVDVDALAVAFVGELLHDVALEWRSVYNVIVGIFRLEHRESLVVTCGEADILGTRCLYLRYPLLGAEARGIEASSQFGVLLVVEVVVGHSPFAGGEHGVESPVKEYSELGVLEVFACRDVVGRGCVGLISVSGCCQR